MLPKNRAALLNEKSTNRFVSNATGTISQNRTYQDLLKNKMDEANFENILTAELYTVNLNGSKKYLNQLTCMQARTFLLMEIT
jgi:hypothetical protein